MTRAFLRTTIFLASALICGAFVVPRQTSTAPFATTAPGGGDRPTAAYAKKEVQRQRFRRHLFQGHDAGGNASVEQKKRGNYERRARRHDGLLGHNLHSHLLPVLGRVLLRMKATVPKTSTDGSISRFVQNRCIRKMHMFTIRIIIMHQNKFLLWKL
uniref:Secreted protein n=1 Tax=Corethron hystrix TaxID=216773 RepID=A0A7S1BK29_9STRA